jgi:glycosyltransferase involved in cell wall biosynthesis
MMSSAMRLFMISSGAFRTGRTVYTSRDANWEKKRRSAWRFRSRTAAWYRSAMFEGKTIAVVIPAFNEETLVARAVSLVPAFVDHVIVVDDASADGTAAALGAVAGRPGLEVIRHEENRGVGAAIATGYARSLALGADVAAVMAGDAQMDPEDLPRLLGPVASGEADYAKGDRLSWPGVFRAMPFFRFVGNHALSVLTRLSSGYGGIRDSQCGYTAIARGALAKLDLAAIHTRYGYPNDLLAHLHSAGARLAQVPVRPIYGEEESGISWFTALVRVPLVLARSFLRRKLAAARSRSVVLEPAERG